MSDSAQPAAPQTPVVIGARGTAVSRSLGLIGVVALGVACISLSSSGLLPFSTIAGLFPGSSIIAILTIAMALSVLHAYTFAAIGTAAPFSGADYVISTRVLNAPIGFASSFLLVVFSALVAGSLIAWIPQSVLPVLLRTYALVTGQIQALQLASSVATPQGTLAVGAVISVIAFVTMLTSTRNFQRWLILGLVLGLAAWGIIFVVFSGSQPAAMETGWERFMGVGSYSGSLQQAIAQGMPTAAAPGITTLAGLLMGFWIFYGYFIATFTAGEVKKPEKNLFRGGIIALVLTWAIFILASYFLNRLVSPEWLSAQSYLYLNGSKEAMPWVTFYAAVLRPDLYLVGIVSLAWIVTLINLVQTYFFYASRIILAWARDGLVPELVGYIHPTSRIPLIAMLLVAIAAQVGLIDAALGNVIGSQLNFVFFAVVSQFAPVLGITLMPFLKKDWFEAAPPFVRRRLFGVPVITIIGAVTLLYLLWLFLSAIFLPSIGSPVGLATLLLLAGILAAGLLLYLVRYYALKGKKQNLTAVFQQYPQEDWQE